MTKQTMSRREAIFAIVTFAVVLAITILAFMPRHHQPQCATAGAREVARARARHDIGSSAQITRVLWFSRTHLGMHAVAGDTREILDLSCTAGAWTVTEAQTG
jgi:hypothetical protein